MDPGTDQKGQHPSQQRWWYLWCHGPIENQIRSQVPRQEMLGQLDDVFFYLGYCRDTENVVMMLAYSCIFHASCKNNSLVEYIGIYWRWKKVTTLSLRLFTLRLTYRAQRRKKEGINNNFKLGNIRASDKCNAADRLTWTTAGASRHLPESLFFFHPIGFTLSLCLVCVSSIS